MRAPIARATAVLLLLVGLAPAAAAPVLTAQAAPGASSLDLGGVGFASTRIVRIASISVSTAAANGLTLSIGSGSVSKADGRTPISFQVALVDRDASPPSSAAFTAPSGTLYTFATGAAASVHKDLYIKYSPAALQDPGAYTANVTAIVVDN